MERVLKIYAKGKKRDELREKQDFLEEYDAFVLVRMSPQAAGKLKGSYLVEDISDQYEIPLESKTVETTARISPRGVATKKAKQGFRAPSQAPHHYLVQFIGPVKEEWLTGVEQVGGEIRQPYQGFTYVVRADSATLDRIRILPFVRWVGHLPHSERIERNVRTVRGADAETLPRTRVVPGAYAVEFFGAEDVRDAKAEVRGLGFKIAAAEPDAQLMVVHHEGTAAEQRKALKELAAVHGVRMIRDRTANRPSNNVAIGIMEAARTIANPSLGLDGDGEVVAICDTGLDTGDAATIHADFAGRVAMLKSYPIAPEWDAYLRNPSADDGPADLDSGHGTHVAGSATGDGSALAGVSGAPQVRGLAVKAKLAFQSVEQEADWKRAADLRKFGRYGLWGIPTNLRPLFNDAYVKQARIHSNSWGGGEPGEYDDQCRQLDQFVWDHKDFCVLVAAGNDGTDEDGDGKINPMSVTSPGTAKNCITVGASENLRPEFNAQKYGVWWPEDYPAAPFKNDPMANNAEQISAFSSRGPTLDGRIKPDVVAPGTFILSTRSTQIARNNHAWAAYPPNKLYFHMGGTSMATPLVAGAAALVRQYLRTVQGIAKPPAALVKATLIAGAVRIGGGNEICDNNQGFGRVNVDAVLAPELPAVAWYVEGGGLRTGEEKSLDFQVTSTTVPLKLVLAYTDFPGDRLVNNLNLIVSDPAGDEFVGNSSSAIPTGFDAKNNVEVVRVASPKRRAWSVRVVGSNVAQGPQDFALVILGAIQE